MSKAVDDSVERIKEIVDEECRPEKMSQEDYIEVLESLIEDFKDRIQVTQSELEGG